MVDSQELLALQRRRKLADQLLAQSTDATPVQHPLQALARMVQAYQGGKEATAADQGMKDYETTQQQDRQRALGEYLTKMRGATAQEQMGPTPDGSPMPMGNPTAPDPQAAMAMLLGAKDPELQRAGMAQALMQNKQDDFTLKPGEQRFSGGKMVATVPEVPKVEREGPKLGQMRRVIRGGSEVDEEYGKDGWQKVGEGPRWQPQQAGAGQEKAPAGYRWGSDGKSLEAIPGGPATPKPSEQYLKQQTGVENVRNAIGDYREALKTYNPAQLVQPEARARMGTIYNNMLLQAKEAYNLGVLNGPDYAILQSVVTDPMSLKGALSRGSLDDQAKKLDALMEKIGKTSATVHNQPAPGGGKFKVLGVEKP